MAIRNRKPCSPMTIAEAAMTVGPVRNLIAKEKVAVVFPQAIILGMELAARLKILKANVVLLVPMLSQPFFFCHIRSTTRVEGRESFLQANLRDEGSFRDC
ncbi:hypothetical protein ACFE04_011391 [Oxalis oulophora]